MKVKIKDKIAYLGLFLFVLSVVTATLNGKTAIILLIASFGTLILGGILKR